MKESKGQKAAKKAWKTIRAQEAEMSPNQLKALHRSRSQAAKKAWKTIRAKKESGMKASATKAVQAVGRLFRGTGFDKGFTKKIEAIRPDWVKGPVKLFSVFWMHPSCACCEFESLGEFKTKNPRLAVEAAVKGKLVLAKDETPARFRTATGMAEMAYFYGGQDAEDTPETLVVLEGSVTDEAAQDIVDEDFKKTAAAKKSWSTMKKQEAKMSSKEKTALHLKRSRAAKKAWKTIRSKAA